MHYHTQSSSTRGQARIESGSFEDEKQWRRDKIVDSGVDMHYVQEYISTTEETETKT